ncbi:MFS general substrate transporter [Aureobasidium subglaciale]|nr:MFS general substrate transporter [Aureobasidium subglaciale]
MANYKEEKAPLPTTVTNFRDVASHVQNMKSGMLFRSGQIDDASREDLDILREHYHIRSVIDLRGMRPWPLVSTAEVPGNSITDHAMQYPDKIASTSVLGLRLHYIDLCGPQFGQYMMNQMGFWERTKGIAHVAFSPTNGIARWKKLQGAKLSQDRLTIPITVIDRSLSQIKAVFKVLADPSSYPILIVNKYGSEMVSLIVTLVCFLLHSDMQDMHHDYMRTYQETAGVRQERLKDIRDSGMTDDHIDPYLPFVNTIERHVREKHGGIEQYLLTVGLDQLEIHTIKNTLLSASALSEKQGFLLALSLEVVRLRAHRIASIKSGSSEAKAIASVNIRQPSILATNIVTRPKFEADLHVDKRMALGILEPRAKKVPGTANVFDQEWKRDPTLKRDRTGNIILVPQPSEDPNDPLNWPLWQRDLMLLLLCVVSAIATTASPLVAANSVVLAVVFRVKFEDAALLTAYHLCGVGVASWLFVPLARVWGKRHVFLFGALLMVISSAWGGSTGKNLDYKSLVWARIFQGIALAPFESLVNDVVGDLYFVHERGFRMAFTNVCLFGAAFLTPVCVGFITSNDSLGWQWSFYFLSIFMGAGFVLLFLFLPETAYQRPRYLQIDVNVGPVPFHDSVPAPPKHSFLHQLAPFSGRKTDESFLKLLLRPFPLFLQPAVAWGCLMQGVIIGWTVIVGVILAMIFLGPPLFFTEEEAGKMYTAAFIGSMIGLVLAGFYTEYVTRILIVRNGGQYEPEFRIALVIPTLVFSGIGLYGFGIAASDIEKYGWLVVEVFLASITISMVMGATASAQYLLDAHRDIAIETFTCLIIFKNLFSFVLAYYAYQWVLERGFERMFVIFGSIEVGICLSSIPILR